MNLLKGINRFIAITQKGTRNCIARTHQAEHFCFHLFQLKVDLSSKQEHERSLYREAIKGEHLTGLVSKSTLSLDLKRNSMLSSTCTSRDGAAIVVPDNITIVFICT